MQIFVFEWKVSLPLSVGLKYSVKQERKKKKKTETGVSWSWKRTLYTQKNVLFNQQKFSWPNKIFRLNMVNGNFVRINQKNIIHFIIIIIIIIIFALPTKIFCIVSKKNEIAN